MAAPEIFWVWGVLDWGAYRASSMEVDPTTSAAGTMADGGWAPNPRPVVLRGYDRAGNLIHTVRSEVAFPDSLEPEFYYRPEYFDAEYDITIAGQWFGRWYKTLVRWDPYAEEWIEEYCRAQQYAWGGTQLDPNDYQWWTPALLPVPERVWPLDNGNLLISWGPPTSLRYGDEFKFGWDPDPCNGCPKNGSGTGISGIAYLPGYVLTLHNRDGYMIRNLSHLPWKPIAVEPDPDGEHFYMAGVHRADDQLFYSAFPNAESGGFHHLNGLYNTNLKLWPHMGNALVRKFDGEGSQVWASRLGTDFTSRLMGIVHLRFVGSRLFAIGYALRSGNPTLWGDPRVFFEVAPDTGSQVKQVYHYNPDRPDTAFTGSPPIIVAAFAQAGMFLPSTLTGDFLNAVNSSQLIDYDLNRIGTYWDIDPNELPDDGLGDTSGATLRKIRAPGSWSIDSAQETSPNVVVYESAHEAVGHPQGANPLNRRVYSLSPTLTLTGKTETGAGHAQQQGAATIRRVQHVMADGWAYGNSDSLLRDQTEFGGYGWPHGNYQIPATGAPVYRHFLAIDGAGDDQWQDDRLSGNAGLNASGGEGLDRMGLEVWYRTEDPPTPEQFEQFRYTDGYGHETSPNVYLWSVDGTSVMRNPETPSIAVPIALAVPEIIGDQSLRPGGVPLDVRVFVPALERRYAGRLLPEVYHATVGSAEVILSQLIIRRTAGRVALTAIAPVSDPAIITALGSAQGQDMVITRGVEFVGGLRQMDFFLSVPLRTVRMDSGANSASLTLEGEAPEPAGTGRLREVITESVERGRDGRVTIRSPQADTYIRPGDRLEGDVVVDEIQLSISPVSTEMVLMGAEA